MHEFSDAVLLGDKSVRVAGTDQPLAHRCDVLLAIKGPCLNPMQTIVAHYPKRVPKTAFQTLPELFCFGCIAQGYYLNVAGRAIGEWLAALRVCGVTFNIIIAGIISVIITAIITFRCQ